MRKFLAFAILLSFVAPASANDYRPYFSRSAGYHEWRKSPDTKKILDSEAKDSKAQEAAAAADKKAADAERNKINEARGNVAKVLNKVPTPCGFCR